MKLDCLNTCFGHDMIADKFKPDEIAVGVKKVDSIIFCFLKILYVKKINSNLTDNSYQLGLSTEKKD